MSTKVASSAEFSRRHSNGEAFGSPEAGHNAAAASLQAQIDRLNKPASNATVMSVYDHSTGTVTSTPRNAPPGLNHFGNVPVSTKVFSKSEMKAKGYVGAYEASQLCKLSPSGFRDAAHDTESFLPSRVKDANGDVWFRLDEAQAFGAGRKA